ncbi:MAG: mechanosensitive ion channel family protein [Pseudomonadales bacterium]|nr:mechanosensitive ion channel family protein [Pseudomonadales bacterium]
MQEQLALVDQVYQLVVNFLVTYSFQLLGAVLVLIGGFMVGGWVSRLLLGVLERREVDVTLRQFIASTVRLVVVGIFLIVALSQLGVSITPLIAAIGGLAVGASFALQGPVSNYGAGLVIILTRMYQVGDTITVQGCSGMVEDISLATTVLRTEDGERIVIPNKQIAGEIHTNSNQYRIVEGLVGIAYRDDPVQAIDVIRRAVLSVEGVATEPPPQVGIGAFGASSIDIDYRFWVPTERYFGVKHRVNLAVFQAIGANGLSIPFPQREVQLLGNGGG